MSGGPQLDRLMAKANPARASGPRSKWRRGSRYGYVHRRRCIAVHEAGHAVIGRVLTLACGYATIKPNKEFLGHTRLASHYVTECEWKEQGKVRKRDAIWHADIMTRMAGAEAEQEIAGDPSFGDHGDRYEILLSSFKILKSDWTTLEPRLRAMTRMLVRRHRNTIESVAEALLAKTTLTAEEIDELAGRGKAPAKLTLLRRTRPGPDYP